MGKGGGCQTYTIGYRYHVGMHLGCCHGPVDEVLGIKAGDYPIFGRSAPKGQAAGGAVITGSGTSTASGLTLSGGVDGIRLGTSTWATNTQGPFISTSGDYDIEVKDGALRLSYTYDVVDEEGTTTIRYNAAWVRFGADGISTANGVSVELNATEGVRIVGGDWVTLAFACTLGTTFSEGLCYVDFASVGGNASINIHQPDIFGGEKREGGISGIVDVLFGDATQLANSYLTGLLGAVPAFRGVLSFVLRQVYVGTNPYIKPWSFLVRHTSHGDWQLGLSRIGNDINPAHIIRSCLTNRHWGMGYGEQDMDDDAFLAAATALSSEGFGLSLIWDQSTDIEGFVAEILKHINGNLYIEPSTGKFVLKLIRQDYNAATLPVFDNTNILEVDEWKRRELGELKNTVILKYLENRSEPMAWDVIEGTPVTTSDVHAWSVDSQYLVAGGSVDGKLWSIDVATWQKSLIHQFVPGSRQGVRAIHFSPNGQWVAIGHGGAGPTGNTTLTVFSVPDWTPISTADGRNPSCTGGATGCTGNSVQFTHDSNYLFVTTTGYGGVIIRTSDWTQFATVSSVGRVWANSPNSNTFWGGQASSATLQRVRQPSTGGAFSTSNFTMPAPIADVKVSPDGLYLFVMTHGGGMQIRGAHDPSSVVATYDFPFAQNNPSIALSPDGRFLVVVGITSPAYTANVYSVDGLALTFLVELDVYLNVWGGVFSPNSLMFAIKQESVPATYGLPTVYRVTGAAGDDIEQSITVHNIGLINQMGGEIVAQEISMMGISKPTLANQVAARELANLSAELSGTSFAANRQAYSLRPGSPFKFRWPEYGVTEEIMRVVGLDYGSLDDNRIRVRAVQDLQGIGEALYSDPVATAWTDPHSKPQAAPYRYYSEMTYWGMVKVHTESPTVWSEIDPLSGHLVGHVARPSSDAIDYGLHTAMSGGAFAYRGRGNFTPTATLTSAIGKTPVTDAVLVIQAGVDLDLVNSGTFAYLGSELVEVVTVTATELVVNRGILDTVPTEHAAGTRIWFAEQWQRHDVAFYLNTEVVDAKATPATSQGELSVGLAPIDSLTFAKRHTRPYAPGKLLIQTASYPLIITGHPLAIAWAHRDRLQQTAYFVMQDEANIGPEAGTTYTVTITDTELSSTVHTESGITGTAPSAFDSVTAGYAPPYLRVVLKAVRGGHDSWQEQDHSFVRHGYGFVYRDDAEALTYGGFADE